MKLQRKRFLEVFAAILPQTVVRGEFEGQLRFLEGVIKFSGLLMLRTGSTLTES